MKKAIVLPLLIVATGLFAHEYVLIAESFFVKKGEEMELHLFVADGFNVEVERPVQKSITRSFGLISENGERNLLLQLEDGSFPVLRQPVDFQGLGLLHMERDYAFITLDNEAFKSYLKHDNIENVQIDETSKSEQSERYTRYIKSLIQSDPVSGDTLYRTRVGHAFEIVLLDNPYALAAEDWLRAQVWFEGKPLVNKAITARNRLGSEAPTVQYARTDANGICTFKLERAGDWFLHATHMVPSRDTAAADWESFWTSFSFGMKE